MEILDILITILPKEIYQLVIIYGILYFLLIFYGSDQWKQYSSFEKVVFSVISGGIVWFFFVFPISFFLTTLKVFQNELSVITNNDLFEHLYLFFIVLVYLIAWYLKGKKSLCDDEFFKDFTQLFIIRIIGFLALVDLGLLVAFFFSTYQDLFRMMSFLLLIILGVSFYLIFLKTLLKLPINDENLAPYLRRGLFLEFISNNKKWTVSILLIIFISSTLMGMFLLTTTSKMVDKEDQRLVIDALFINRPNVDLSGTLFVTQNYTIKFGLIPWTKIKLNISSVDESDKTKTPDYNFSGNYLFIKNSSWNTINIKPYGWKRKYNISEFHTLKISDLNDKIQRWDINFYNPYLYDIDIYEVVVEKGNQLKLINYSKNLALGEVVNDPTDHQITIKHVELPKYWNPQYANYSISLFFGKNDS